MSHRAITALARTLQPRVGLGKSRLETMCLLIVGMVSARTVNLGHIACERPGSVLIASTYRRLQRFFQYAALPQDWAVAILADLIASRGPWTLALDRTQWAIGAREVNFLVLAVVTRRLRVPLLWTLLPRAGNSHTRVRIDLVRRYLARFPASSIRLLLADREFVGTEWLQFLNDNKIPFAIRLRENLECGDGGQRRAPSLRPAARQPPDPHLPRRLWADGAADGPLLAFAAKRLKDEWLVVVSNVPPRAALAAYRKRWAIECLFGDAKTRGLNLEDTRLSDPRKLDLLMALVALALAWAGRAASDLLRRRERAPQGARISGAVLVPYRVRSHPKPPQDRPGNRSHPMARQRARAGGPLRAPPASAPRGRAPCPRRCGRSTSCIHASDEKPGRSRRTASAWPCASSICGRRARSSR